MWSLTAGEGTIYPHSQKRKTTDKHDVEQGWKPLVAEDLFSIPLVWSIKIHKVVTLCNPVSSLRNKILVIEWMTGGLWDLLEWLFVTKMLRQK